MNADLHAATAPPPQSGSRRTKVLGTLTVVLTVMVALRILFPVPLPHIQLPAETLWVLPGNIAFTNTMLAVVTTDVLLILFAIAVRRKLALVPSGIANVAEAIVEFWQAQAEQLVGADLAKRWLPLVLTMFFLIGLANWSELIPGYDTVGLACQECPHAEGSKEQHHTRFEGFSTGPMFMAMRRAEVGLVGHEAALREGDTGTEAEALDPAAEAPGETYSVIPFYRAAATDLNFTVALALIAFFVIQFAGFRALGVGGYLGKFFNFKEGGLGLFVGIIELISELSRIISFAFRLFGNIFAGQVLLFVIPFLLAFLVPVLPYGLELFVGLIQAYVFAVLTLAFMAAAVTAHQHDAH